MYAHTHYTYTYAYTIILLLYMGYQCYLFLYLVTLTKSTLIPYTLIEHTGDQHNYVANKGNGSYFRASVLKKWH